MSNINFLNINENFPVAGQDNDTQVFRDNFDTIKTNFRLAQEEITALQNSTGGLDTQDTGSVSTPGANFNGRVIQNAVFDQNLEKIFDGIDTQGYIDFEFGPYQIIEITKDQPSFSIQRFPGDISRNDIIDGVGKITVELRSNSNQNTHKITFIGLGGAQIKKSNFPTLELAGAHDLEVSSKDDPIILEIWSHNANNNIYLNYIGQFS